MKENWRDFSSFVPPKPRAINPAQDHNHWYWVTWGGEPYLCRYEDGMFLPVAGGMVMGASPKMWMPLRIPPVFPR